MTHLRINFRKLLVTSVWLLVAMSSTAVFAQSQPDGRIPREGISSYVLSPFGITALLVLALVAQIFYRQRTRVSKVKATAPFISEPVVASKKRYDRDELSKLLKASATSKNSGRSLEEAIRLSQVIQPDIVGDVEVDPGDVATAAPESVGSESIEDYKAIDISTDAVAETEVQSTLPDGDESKLPVSDDEHAVKP